MTARIINLLNSSAQILIRLCWYCYYYNILLKKRKEIFLKIPEKFNFLSDLADYPKILHESGVFLLKIRSNPLQSLL